MNLEIKKIHDEVFSILWANHNKDRDNFFFITRKINRYNKLDEGYWFLGNDNYLAISFWTGIDSLTRTPRIYFKIKVNGETSLEFRNKDISGHSDYFSPDFIKSVGARETENGYSKKFSITDYKESLSKFLTAEKQLIDEHLKAGSLIDEGVVEWVDPIEFIKSQSFKKQIETINSYRNRSVDGHENVGILRGFSILNFGMIQDISLDIKPENKWIILTGENGSGKTSILKAIATGLGQNNDDNDRIASKEKFGAFRIKILLNGEYDKIKEVTVKSNQNYKGLKTLVDGFVTYGPVRLFSEGTIDSGIVKNEFKVHKKTTYGLFNPVGILKDLSSYALNVRPKYFELAKDSIIGNLEYILPKISQIEEDEEGNLFFYEISDVENVPFKKVTFDELPSGTRNFAALILDLLIRFQNQQPDVTDVADYKGVVIIDEIDIHLHPKLQMELVKQLAATFPKVQFIVSTHSPVTLLGAPENSVFLKVTKSSNNGINIQRLEKLESEIKYLTPNTILTSDIFDFDFLQDVDEDDIEKVHSEDDYEDIQRNREIDEKLRDMDSTIFPENLFNEN